MVRRSWHPSLVAVIALSVTAATACARSTPLPAPATGPERLRAKVIRSFPHDPAAYTQGLLLYSGKVYESTGLLGRSSVRRVDLESGAVEAQVSLDATLFGEGLARVGGRLFQLTWQNGKAIVWNLTTLGKERELSYEGEGWGLCYDGRELIMSDGSDRLTFRDPETFASKRQVTVRRSGQPVRYLNELECVDGLVYANVWQDSHIARIDPKTGDVTAWIDASGLLLREESTTAEVLNGIAQLPGTNRFLLTGKLWPRSFEVEFVPSPSP
jgi:glutaminyl-peptide cyclotransferase